MELIDVLDEQSNLTGEVKPRDQIHRAGYWHRAIHVWIINSKHELLLQRRSKEKISHPNMWGMSSVGGHIGAGDTSLPAAKREIQEEIGYLGPTNLEAIGTIKVSVAINNTYFDNEFIDIFLCPIDIQLNSLSLQSEEVAEVKWVRFTELETIIATKNPKYVIYEEEYQKLFALLHQRFDIA